MRSWQALTMRQRWTLGAVSHVAFILSASAVVVLTGSFWLGLAGGVLVACLTAWAGTRIVSRDVSGEGDRPV